MNYEIKGGNLPVVCCQLAKGESVQCEAGAMAWMDPGIEMSTHGNGLGKMFGRLMTNENMFMNTYVANQAGEIAFSSSFPGSIRAVRVTPSTPIIIQKGAFLASMGELQNEVYFQKKIAGGFFGGEGFLMRKISGNGMVFLEIDGSAIEYVLAPSQKKIIDTGYLAMMDASCSLDIVTIKGVKNILLGGEGLFNTVITGPGTILLQTLPVNQLAMTLSSLMPHS